MSDQTDFSIVIILVVGLYFYLNYIKGQIKLKNDYYNRKCNPVTLFLSSINSNAEESIKQFSSCVTDFNDKKIADASTKS